MTLMQAERRAKRLSRERSGIWAAVEFDDLYADKLTFEAVPYNYVNSDEFEAYNGQIRSVYSYGEEI